MCRTCDKEEPEVEEIYKKGSTDDCVKPKKEKINHKLERTKSKLNQLTQKQVFRISSEGRIRGRRYLRIQQRILFWASHLDRIDVVEYFIKRRCSPFMITYSGQSPLHRAAQQGSLKTLKLILNSDYYYRYVIDFRVGCSKKRSRQKKLIDKIEIINQVTEEKASTPLHLAIENHHQECVDLLLSMGASTQVVNYRNKDPFGLSTNQHFIRIHHSRLQIESKQHHKSDNFYEKGFLYCLQTRGKSRLEDDIIFHQLLNIKSKFEKKQMTFEFLCLFSSMGQSKLTLKNSQIFYVIKLTPDTIFKLAHLQQFILYNLKNKRSQRFLYHERHYFEYPKDLDLQKMILTFLNEEFDVDKFIMEGLLVQHFPIQNCGKFRQMMVFWRQELHTCVLQTLWLDNKQNALRPLHSMAQYYGPVIGWYFAFLVQLVAWLLIPSVLAFSLTLYCIVMLQTNSFLFPIYGLIMVVWASFFLESWKRRENELSYCWDMHLFKKSEQQRIMYQGQFHISNLTNLPEVADKFTAFQRRLMSDVPVMLIGISIVVACFLIIQYLIVLYQVQQNNYIRAGFGAVTALVISTLSWLYKRMVNHVVIWENHKYDSDFEFSYILKIFIFEFINSYIMLFYQAIVIRDPNQLSTYVASIVITKGIIQNLKSNLFPYFIYKFKIRKKVQQIRRAYHGKKSSIREDIKSPRDVQGRLYLFKNLGLSCQVHLVEALTVSQQYQLLSQLQKREFLQNQKHLVSEYTDLAIQFGYITMFATSFPPGPIFFMINCYLNLRFSLHNYTHVMKREQAKPSQSIGIWLYIFNIMSYSATVMNCIVIGISYLDKFSEVVGSDSPLFTVQVLLVIEHSVLFVKYLIQEFIDDVPAWVQRDLKRCAAIDKQRADSNI